MKKHMLMVAMAFAMSTQAATTQPERVASTQLKPIPAQTQAALWASRLLGRYHYKATPLDDAMSEKIFDKYFESLDGEGSSRKGRRVALGNCRLSELES